MLTTQTNSLRILVPLDGSDRAKLAIPVAATLAAGIGARVILLRVVTPPTESYPELVHDFLPLVDVAERQADEELRGDQAAFAGLAVTRRVLVGRNAGAEITAWLRRNPVDFVVLTAGRRRGLRRWLGRSVAETVRRSGLASVIAVDSGPTDKSGQPLAVMPSFGSVPSSVG